MELIGKSHKPVALFVDDAHGIHNKTLSGLKRLIELVHQNGGLLSVVLAGHPRLRNDLCRPNLEEIGARASLFTLEGIRGHQSEYILWALQQATQGQQKPQDLLTSEAMDFLADKLATPLQINQYLTLAFEQAYQVGQKPITLPLVKEILTKELNDIEPHLIRHGYSAKVLADLLNVRTAEVKSFLHNQLPMAKTQDLKERMLKIGIPLRDTA